MIIPIVTPFKYLFLNQEKFVHIDYHPKNSNCVSATNASVFHVKYLKISSHANTILKNNAEKEIIQKTDKVFPLMNRTYNIIY